MPAMSWERARALIRAGKLSTAPYGWGHPEEHKRVALKGWRVRHSHDHEHVAHLWGSELSRPHHHKDKTAFQDVRTGDWYAVPRKEWKRLAHEGSKIKHQEERETRLGERLLHAEEEQEHAAIVKELRRKGGVRPTGKHDRGEWEMLPASIRKANGHFSLDAAREHIAQHYPHLKMDTPDDLVRYFEDAHHRRLRRRAHVR